VLEFNGVQPGELDGDRRGTRDARRGVVVGDVHLFHVTAGDHVALRGAAVARHHHPTGIRQRHDRGSVRQRVARCEPLMPGPGSVHGQKLGRLTAEQFRKR
jgi:hypothetical protein